jgi:hypothetical protein
MNKHRAKDPNSYLPISVGQPDDVINFKAAYSCPALKQEIVLLI